MCAAFFTGAKGSLREANRILDRAKAEGRRLTTDELVEADRLIQAAERDMEIGRERDAWLRGDGDVAGPGDRFILSEGWKSVSNPDTRPQRWTTGAVEISPGPMQSKAGTLLESGQGGGLTPVPQVIPGIVQKLQEPLGVADLLPSQVATTSSVRYVVEGTATSGAAGVAEGGVKPPSDLAYSTVDEPVR